MTSEWVEIGRGLGTVPRRGGWIPRSVFLDLFGVEKLRWGTHLSHREAELVRRHPEFTTRRPDDGS